MTSGHDFKAPVGHIAIVYGEEDSQVLDVLDMCVGRAVEVGGEAACERELVVD